MAESPSERGARRKAETRKRLLEAARGLFVTNGYHATRPQDIAREAGVAIGTFYLHFDDKWAIFLAFSEEALRELTTEISARVRSDSGFESQLYAALDALFDYGDRNPGVLRVALMDRQVIGPDAGSGQSLRERLSDVLGQSLERAMASGELRDDYDPRLIGAAIVGMIYQGTAYWSVQGRPRDELLQNLVLFCTRALLNNPATGSA